MYLYAYLLSTRELFASTSNSVLNWWVNWRISLKMDLQNYYTEKRLAPWWGIYRIMHRRIYYLLIPLILISLLANAQQPAGKQCGIVC